MKAIEFADFLDDFQKSKEIQLGSDVVYNMIDYFKSTYEKYNYTFFELIYILTVKKGIRTINCACNKSALLKMIREEKLDFPFNYHQVQPTKWGFWKGRSYTCISVCVKNYPCISFYKDDIFQTKGGDILTITNIKREDDGDEDNDTYKRFKNVDNVFVYFTKKDTQGIESEICMSGADFIDTFDNDNMSIIFCNTLNNTFGIQTGIQKQNPNKRQKFA